MASTLHAISAVMKQVRPLALLVADHRDDSLASEARDGLDGAAGGERMSAVPPSLVTPQQRLAIGIVLLGIGVDRLLNAYLLAGSGRDLSVRLAVGLGCALASVVILALGSPARRLR